MATLINTVPHPDDMEKMVDIHERLCRRASLLVPMNGRDEGVFGDAVIPFQDEAYACGRERGAADVRSQPDPRDEALKLARKALNAVLIGDRPYVVRCHAAIARIDEALK